MANTPVRVDQLSAQSPATVSALNNILSLDARLSVIHPLVAKLNNRSDNVAIGFAGDSTGDERPEWFYRLWSDICAARPWIDAAYYGWDDPSQTYTPYVLQAGVAPTRIVRTAWDTFARTAADLKGTSGIRPIDGTVWGGASGAWSLDGNDAVWAASTGYVSLPGAAISGSGARTASGTITLDTTAGAATKRLSIGIYTAGTNAERLTLWINISTGGAITWGIDGQLPSYVSLVTGGGTPLASASVQTVTWSLTLNGSSVTAVLNGVSASASLNGTQTTSAAAMFALYALGAGTLTGWKLNDMKMEVTTVESVQSLAVYNGSKAGSTLTYQQARIASLYPVALDALFISSSHNYGTDSPATYQSELDTFIAAFRSVQPNAVIVVSSQNPETPPQSSTSITAHRSRVQSLRAYAAKNGYGYIPAYQAFLANWDPLLVRSDGVHPTAISTFDGITSDPVNGQYVWKEAAKSYLTAAGLA